MNFMALKFKYMIKSMELVGTLLICQKGSASTEIKISTSIHVFINLPLGETGGDHEEGAVDKFSFGASLNDPSLFWAKKLNIIEPSIDFRTAVLLY
jgi:hypothetical protein